MHKLLQSVHAGNRVIIDRDDFEELVVDWLDEHMEVKFAFPGFVRVVLTCEKLAIESNAERKKARARDSERRFHSAGSRVSSRRSSSSMAVLEVDHGEDLYSPTHSPTGQGAAGAQLLPEEPQSDGRNVSKADVVDSHSSKAARKAAATAREAARVAEEEAEAEAARFETLSQSESNSQNCTETESVANRADDPQMMKQRAVSLEIDLEYANECRCGYLSLSWQSMLSHFDQSEGHSIRHFNDESEWEGPITAANYGRLLAGPNAGCTLEQQMMAAQNQGKRMDLLTPLNTPTSTRGAPSIDLSGFDAEFDSASCSPTSHDSLSPLGSPPVSPTSRDYKSKIPRPPSEILPGLMWQAGRKDCDEMGHIPHGCFTHSIYALNHSPCATPFACEESFFVDLVDQLSAVIQPYFVPVCEWIDEARKKTPDCRVVVHCQHGQSRSGAIVCAYVMWHLKMSLKDTVQLVQKARPALRMNVAFLSQLQAFEQDLFGIESPSISLEQLDEMDVCKCYYAINEVPCEVARGKRDCSPWTPRL